MVGFQQFARFRIDCGDDNEDLDAMKYVSDRIYADYLRMGQRWPQLRSPLALAVLAASTEVHGHPWNILQSEKLTESQRQKTIRAAAGLHRAHAIPARPLTQPMADLEWQRTLSAAAYLLVSALASGPFARYDPYFDYLESSRKNGRLASALENEAAVRPILAGASSARAILRANAGLAKAFRASFVPAGMRAGPGAGHGGPAAGDADALDSSAGIRRRILLDLRRQILAAAGAMPSAAADALALGMDWKQYEEPEGDR